MRSPSKLRSTRFFGPTAVFPSYQRSRYRAGRSQQMVLTPQRRLGATRPQTDTASSSASSSPSKTQALSLSTKRISWTSQRS
jgi:hypothetical protein